VNEQQIQIAEDLSGLMAGEVRCDALAVSMYSSDASLFQIQPLGIAFPKNREDVVVIARYAEEQNIPLIARGAGTNVVGAALGKGLIVDFSRHMHTIEAIGVDTVRVQPGVVLNQLNKALKERGQYFPPDPSNANVTTIGSMLAVDAAGSHAARVGSTRDHILNLEIVLPGGHVLEIGNERLDILQTPAAQPANMPVLIGEDEPSLHDQGLKRTIISKLVKIISDNENLIRKHQPPLLRNCSGYFLRGILGNNSLNLPRLLAGSEGTLGLITSATLHTSPLPPHRGVVLILFGQMEAAIQAVQAIIPQQPSAFDLLDRRLLNLAREADPRFEKMISPHAEAALIVEQLGFSSEQVADRLQMVIRSVRSINQRAIIAHEAYEPEDVDFLWSLPQKVVALLSRLKGQIRPLPFVEDIAVPPDSLQDFLVQSQKVMQKYKVTASLYAHAASGQLHIRPFLPTPIPQDTAVMENLASELYQAVFSVGGTISGEHGDGIARTAYVQNQYGPMFPIFRQVKDLFDPHNLLNPGKIISDDERLATRYLRHPAPAIPDIIDLQLKWTSEEMAQAASRCNGCGSCKTNESTFRMCPLFRLKPEEDASPRAKANVIRDLASGAIGPDEMTSAEMKELSDLCFNCKQCELECPSNVKIAQLMIETKAAYVSVHGLNRTDWLLSRAHSFGALGCTIAPFANWVIGHPQIRWVLDKLLGIAEKRKLPQFARRSYLRSMDRRLAKKPRFEKNRKPVIYFVDHYANYHDPELARAFVAVLQHNRIPVYVPPNQVASGMAMISAGELSAAKLLAEENIRELSDLARDGCPIVCTEPSAALALKEEYPQLLDSLDATTVADRTIEAGAYLLDLHQAGLLKTDFNPLKLDVAYHTPCHLRALGDETPFKTLLSLIPGLQVHTIEEGCSGMAGAYGVTSENFQTSIQIGWGLISKMRDPDLDSGTTECSSCKIQMEQGTTTPTLHPIKLLALAYGLMPEIQSKLTTPSKPLVVS